MNGELFESLSSDHQSPDIRTKLDVLFWHFYGEYADLAEQVKGAAAQLEDAHRLFIGDGDRLPGIIGQMREVSGREIQAVRETQTRLDALSQNLGGFESRVSRLIGEVATDAFLDDQAKRILERISKEVSRNVLESILERSVHRIAISLDKETRRVASEALAKFNANSAIELGILFEKAQRDFAREMDDAKSRAAIEVRAAQAERDIAIKSLNLEKKFSARSTTQWVLASLFVGVVLGIVLVPAVPSLLTMLLDLLSAS